MRNQNKTTKKPPIAPPAKRLSRRSDTDARPVPLKAVHNSESRYLILLQNIALQLENESHPLGTPLAEVCKGLNQMRAVRQEIVEHDKLIHQQSAKQKKSKATQEQLLSFKAAFIKKYGKEHGWKTAAMQEFGIKDHRTFNEMLE